MGLIQMDLSEMLPNDTLIQFSDTNVNSSDSSNVFSLLIENVPKIATFLDEQMKSKNRMFISCSRLGYKFYVSYIVPLLSSDTLQKGYAIFRSGPPAVIN